MLSVLGGTALLRFERLSCDDGQPAGIVTSTTHVQLVLSDDSLDLELPGVSAYAQSAANAAVEALGGPADGAAAVAAFQAARAGEQSLGTTFAALGGAASQVGGTGMNACLPTSASG